MRKTATKTDLVAVEVPEWERTVYIRALSVREGLNTEQAQPDPALRGVEVLIASLVDENGEQLLTKDDLDLILDQPLGIITPLLVESAKQNGFTGKELEEAVQAFAQARGGSNSTESPSLSGGPSMNSKDSLIGT